MKPSSNQFAYARARIFAAAALAATLALAPMAVFAAGKDPHQDRAELRITELHAKLKITPAQEEQWGKVAQVMRDDAKNLDTLTQARVEHAKDMTAVDDLKSYGEIAEAHADGVKKLLPVFTALYDGMSDAQKKDADALFRRGYHKHGAHKHGREAPAAK